MNPSGCSGGEVVEPLLPERRQRVVVERDLLERRLQVVGVTAELGALERGDEEPRGLHALGRSVDDLGEHAQQRAAARGAGELSRLEKRSSNIERCASNARNRSVR